MIRSEGANPIQTVSRSVVGFFQDDEMHWVARLDCGHNRHMRHNPPMVSRPWVLTAERRAEQIGQMTTCMRCARFEMPPQMVAYKRTPVFTEETIPRGLLADHATKRGVWARIVVEEGAIAYIVEALEVRRTVTSAAPDVIVPEIRHRVAAVGMVRFFVRFYRAAGLT
ncbi:MAG: DUF3565 domain-containing protein [Myxococcota bacterium]